MYGRLCAQCDSDTDDKIYRIQSAVLFPSSTARGIRASCSLHPYVRTLSNHAINATMHNNPHNDRANSRESTPCRAQGFGGLCSVGARVSARSAVNSICDWVRVLAPHMQCAAASTSTLAPIYLPAHTTDPRGTRTLINHKLKGLEC